MRKVKRRHATTTLSLCGCLLLLLSCAPVQIPHRGSLDGLPVYPEAWAIEPVPDEVVDFMTTVKQRVGPACPGVWRSYVANASADETLVWYQRAMPARGWWNALDTIPLPSGAAESKTWTLFTRSVRSSREMVALFINPVGITVAQPEEPDPEATSPFYTYILLFACPIHELAAHPYAR